MKNQETKKIFQRPPIAVVMGHVDHGKTKILDWYRKTKVVESESGGITQHIGAYEVDHRGKKITFIDTPGHEAFSKLRSRGARVADIAILVIAADEGVKPQTKEAIDIINQNHLPFVVALNKIDKPEANPDRVKQELAKAEVLVESYGGKVPSVEVSAKDGKNMDDLLEVLLILAELEDLSADPEKPGEGVVIEAHRDPRRGTTVTLLVQDGTLSHEHVLVVGGAVETFKIFEDFLGHSIEKALPSTPVLVVGLNILPAAGESFKAFSSKKEAEAYRASAPLKKEPQKISWAASGEEGRPVFNIILKADVSGSKEALEGMIGGINSDAIELRIIKSEVGDINESDVKTAQATNRVTIAGFRVGVDSSARKLAEEANIRIFTGEVIYELFDALKSEIEERIPPEVRRVLLGRAKILKIFNKEGQKQIIGGRVEEGTVKKGTKVEIRRNKERIGEGNVVELQRNKIPAPEVLQGSEFGMLLESRSEIREGDLLEVFVEEIIKKKL